MHIGRFWALSCVFFILLGAAALLIVIRVYSSKHVVWTGRTQANLVLSSWIFLPLLPSARGSPGASDGKESSCNAGDPGLIPELGRSPGGGHGNPLQYSCLENPMGREACRATVHRGSKSWTTEHKPFHV